MAVKNEIQVVYTHLGKHELCVRCSGVHRFSSIAHRSERNVMQLRGVWALHSLVGGLLAHGKLAHDPACVAHCHCQQRLARGGVDRAGGCSNTWLACGAAIHQWIPAHCLKW